MEGRMGGRLTEWAYTLLRIVVGFLFFCHGAQKILGGFLTHVVAFLLSGEMAVAYFMAHAPHGFIPLLNHGELAVLYCFIFLFIAAHSAGPFSVDASIGRRRRP